MVDLGQREHGSVLLSLLVPLSITLQIKIWQTIYIKGQIVNILNFSGHIISVAAVQTLPVSDESRHRQYNENECVRLFSNKSYINLLKPKI